MEFKDKLREARQQQGMTQEQLAQRAGTSLGNVRNYEQGLRLPSWAAVVRLCRALGVSCEVFSDCIPAEEAPAGKPAPKKPRGRPRKGK